VDTALLRRLSELINDIAALSLQDEITLEEVRALQEELNTLSNLVYGR
jgi:hypothetical protein